jgi:formate dehydrogenase iron-sulfur subunit
VSLQLSGPGNGVGGSSALPVLPLLARTPKPGEQYRFHFDMTKCVGCKCCVVACNEQNGNPGDLHWRKVGEIEGGLFPDTRRLYLSMGCNHCLEPSCLNGCPVEAYTKIQETGIVEHNPDICIGCQYCTWNCSYGVPQYNPERGTVGKCDMCHQRLSDGDAPACVEACPQDAIEIEIVNIAQWRADHSAADAPGLPSSFDSLSTTRVTLPAEMPWNIDRVDRLQSKLEDPHWPLVWMLTLTQMSVGAICSIWSLATIRHAQSLLPAVLLTLSSAFVSLTASALHLGRPIYAYRAVKGWRRSWLSREVLALGLFAHLAAAYAACLFFHVPGSTFMGAAAVVMALAGIYCSARIYLVPARPSWNTRYTVVEFFLTACLLGPLWVRAAGLQFHNALAVFAAFAGSGQLVTQITKLLWMTGDGAAENQASSLLLLHRLRNVFLLRIGLLLAGGLVLPLTFSSPLSAIAALLIALAGELMGRWLFFVGTTPKSIASGFVVAEKAA